MTRIEKLLCFKEWCERRVVMYDLFADVPSFEGFSQHETDFVNDVLALVFGFTYKQADDMLFSDIIVWCAQEIEKELVANGTN